MDLVGREDDMSALWRILDERSVLLIGPRRIGKTEILRAMAATPKDGFIGVRVDLQQSSSVVDAVARISDELERKGILEPLEKRAERKVQSVGLAGLEIALRDAEALDPWRRLGGVLALATRAASKGSPRTLFLALDELPWWLDEVRKREGADAARGALAALRYLRQRDDLAPNLRMVLTGSVGLAGLAHLVGATAELNDVLPHKLLGPLSPEAGRAIFEARLTFNERSSDRSAPTYAHRVAGGFPHWIKVLADRVVAVQAPGEIVTEESVDRAVEALLDPRMRYLFDDESDEHFRRRYDRSLADQLIHVLSAAATAGELAHREVLITAALAAGAESRAEALQILDILVDEFYLEEDRSAQTYRFLLPLLQRWWLWYGRAR